MKLWVMFLALVMAARADSNETTEAAPRNRLLAHKFTDYTLMALTGPEEPWQASWNDAGQMAMISNPSNGVVITSQYLKLPDDPALTKAIGDREQYLTVALRKYCVSVFTLSGDVEVGSQTLNIQSRTLGEHFFRYTPIWGRARGGGRRLGYFYVLLRGPADKPRFDGEVLALTIGYPEALPSEVTKATLRTFDVMLQNLSFY